MIGKKVSHYEILEKLGEGGMGVVYKARDTKLDRLVALKFLPPRMSASKEDRARFVQEAKSAAALNHPNVCSIIDIQEHDGQLYIVMEFVDGQTLSALKDSISFKQAVDIGVQIAEGLAAAHEKGIVHRDIKPDNIMRRKDGIVVIMDFGLAKLRASGSKITRLTRVGSTLGTLGYMSPEQVQGEEADHRSDIFSFGVLLYELCTGELPFKAVHETALMYEIVNTDPAPMSSVKTDIDPELDRIVLECLQKEPDERYNAVKDIAKDLRRVKRESGRQRGTRTVAIPSGLRGDTGLRESVQGGHRWRELIWPGIAAVAVLSLLGVLWAFGIHGTPRQSVTRLGIILPGDQILSSATYTSIALSPDGSQLAYKASGKLYLRNMGSYGSTPLTGAEEGSGPFYSPDGKWIGFFSSGVLKKISVNGGTSLILADAYDNRGAVWGKNGDIIFAAVPNGGLMRLSGEGKEPRPLTYVDTTKNERTHRWPSFLPDGKTVIYTVGTMDHPDYYDDSAIDAVNIETGQKKHIMQGGSYPRYISPGFLLYWNSSTLFAVPFDPAKLEVTGTALPVVDGVNGDQTTGVACYALAENGTLAYLPGDAAAENLALVRMDLKGMVTPFGAPLKMYQEPRISPDGKRIAVVVQSGKDSDVWLYDIARSSLSRFTFGGLNRTPYWSPDGSRIAYYCSNGGKFYVAIKRADGVGLPEMRESPIGRAFIEAWTKDGQNLIVDNAAYPGVSGGSSDLYVFPLSGDRKPWPLLATKFDEWQAALSPDGKWYAYVSNESGTSQVYLRSFPMGGRSWQVSTEEAYEPRWAPDGRTLYFVSPGRFMSVSIQLGQVPVIGTPKGLFGGINPKITDSGLHYDVARDGLSIVTMKSPADNENLRQIHVVLNWFDDIQGKTQKRP